MAKAKVIELSEQELIDIVDRYEYLSTLLNSKITPNINRLEKLENERINIDVLVKELTSTKEFLAAVNAKVALISASKENEYKHPHQEVIARYKSRKQEIYLTADKGDIVIEGALDKIRTER